MAAAWVWRFRERGKEVLRWRAHQIKAERVRRTLCHTVHGGGVETSK